MSDALLVAAEARIRASTKRIAVARSRDETNRPELLAKYRGQLVAARLARVLRLDALERIAERDRRDQERRAFGLLHDPFVVSGPGGRLYRRIGSGELIEGV